MFYNLTFSRGEAGFTALFFTILIGPIPLTAFYEWLLFSFLFLSEERLALSELWFDDCFLNSPEKFIFLLDPADA